MKTMVIKINTMKIEEIKNIEEVEITEVEEIEASIDKIVIGNKEIIKKIDSRDSQDNLEKNLFMLIRKQEKNQKTKKYLNND